MTIELFKVFMAPTNTITTVDQFETKLKEFFDYPYILTVNSFTAGFELMLPKSNYYLSKNILTSHTNIPLLNSSFNIRWVDNDPTTCNMDLDDLERKIVGESTVIIATHWNGHPIDLNRLNDIRLTAERKFNTSIQIIEDCSQAFGALYDNRFVGTHGNICVFNLESITGEGGLIFLPNEEMYENVKLLRSQISMNDISASIGRANLPFVQRHLQHTREVAGYYEDNLSNLPWIRLIKIEPSSKSSFWSYTIHIQQKNRFIEWMKRKGIVSQQFRRNCGNNKDLVCIPCGWWVSKSDAQHIVHSIRQFCLSYINIVELTADKVEEYVDLLYQLNHYRVPDDVDVMAKYDEMKSCGGKIFLMYIGDELVASGKCWKEPKFGADVLHVEDIVVDKEYRGQGVGRMMVEHIKRIGIQQNCHKILLNARDDLRKFYEACEFRDEGTQLVYRISS